ncbi:hypothetical protein LuPra_01687 [Luteitalea pratensis]|uniref:Uncharacterized protein n=1 Tax=Luteitalea pratensis TaxID=1855912 RepID=A0A143PIU6_LUTPR|nr:hypothetical protein LuPra_01687 [Luteitalea pratensis]
MCGEPIQDQTRQCVKNVEPVPTNPPAGEGSVLPIPLKGMKIAVSAIAEA